MSQDKMPTFLIRVINQYFNRYIKKLPREKKKGEIRLTVKSINIFLKYLHKPFKDKFWSKLIPELQKRRKLAFKQNFTSIDLKRLNTELNIFSNILQEKYQGYFKIFLSRDAYFPFICYSKLSKTKDAIELLYTRKRVLGTNNGSQYLSLINLSYKNWLNNYNLSTFITYYMQNLKKHFLYKTIVTNTHDILNQAKVFTKIKQNAKVLLIDTGLQGGLILPFYTHLRDLGIETDFYLYTCVSWIYPLFKDNVFTKDISLLELLERQSVKLYEKEH